MVGNVYSWSKIGAHNNNYNGAPPDGSAWSRKL
jgi:formylglycine-generating enzyme required for sulfatase activity